MAKEKDLGVGTIEDVSFTQANIIDQPVPDEGPDARRKSKLSRLLSQFSRGSSKEYDHGPPPDGGFQAWGVGKIHTITSLPGWHSPNNIPVVASHLVLINTWGLIISFGTFQTYYTEALNRTPSEVAWIGSMQVFLLFFLGTLTGRLTDAGYLRHVIALGSVFQILGIFMTSLATTYWQLLLAQGVCIGLGNGFTFCPSIAVLPTYFSKRRGLAIGIVFTGTGVGGLVFPAIVRELLPRVGLSWTVRAIGFIELANLVVVNLLLKTRLPPRKGGALVDWPSFRNPEYVLVLIGVTLVTSLPLPPLRPLFLGLIVVDSHLLEFMCHFTMRHHSVVIS